MVKTFLCWTAMTGCLYAQGGAAGIFEGATDVGTVLLAGSVEYDDAKRSYQIAGSGDNMWAAADAFHYVWKKVSGDVTLTADVSILGTGGEGHRKAVLMIRQSLDADSAYADAAVHGDGLTSIQGRAAKGGNSSEVQSNVSRPTRLRIAKWGDYFYLWVAKEGEELRFSGGAMRVRLQEPFYVGLGVCAHNKDNTERAVFSNVELTASAAASGGKPELYSTIETFPAPGDRRANYAAAGRIEAPAWSRDGASLTFVRNGHLERVAAAGGAAHAIDTGAAAHLVGHHGLSPDASLIAFTDEPKRGGAAVYVTPASGGVARRVTRQSPSYFEGWSPDGKTLIFTAERKGKRDVYTIPVEGGTETRLTTAKGLNESAEFSPDGEYVYFNSDRSGVMQVWRMRPGGSEQEQVTTDDASNWRPHVSPDGKRIAMLSLDRDAKSLPVDQEVTLRVMLLADKRVTTAIRLVGGQGSFEAPAWSPDGRRLAFVSYQWLR